MHRGSTDCQSLSDSSHGLCEAGSTAKTRRWAVSRASGPSGPATAGVRLTRISVPMKLSAIACALDVRLENGSPHTEITGLNGIERAGPGELTFVSNPKYSAVARTTKASAVIVGESFPAIAAAMLRAKDPYLTFARALELFHQPLRYAPGMHPTAVVHASTKVGPNAHIGPYVVVDENVAIGANAVLLAPGTIFSLTRTRSYARTASLATTSFCRTES